MRNLTVQSHVVKNFNHHDEFDLRQSLDERMLCCVNPDNDLLYALRERRLWEISSKDVLKITAIDLVAEECGAGRGRPVGLEYSSDVGQLWCAYNTGAIICVDAEPELRQEATNRIADGLKCIKLSPDREILVLVTADDTVVTTVSNFHVVSKVDLCSGEYGKNQFVTVGWGKKETQFHGSEGKAAAKAPNNAVNAKNANDDREPQISWRGDGAMFAVSFVRRESQERLLKVFNRDGVLGWTGELTAGMEPLVAWKPSGNIIATSLLLPDRRAIAFFEKNGLKHRELTIPLKPKEIQVIIGMTWSHDSEILSIWLRESESAETCLQLWTENNYHWYLKRTIKFPDTNTLVYFTWSSAPRAGKRLIVLTRKNTMTYTFRWSVDHSRGIGENDRAVVAVVDGREAALTGFRLGIVPPPMAHTTVKFNEAINSIIFAPAYVRGDSWLDSNVFMCHLSDNRLALCLRSQTSRLLEYNHVRTYEIEWKRRRRRRSGGGGGVGVGVGGGGDGGDGDDGDDGDAVNEEQTYSLHHFLWFKEHVLLCSASSDTRSSLCVLDLEGEDFRNEGRVLAREVHESDDWIEHVISSPDENVAYIVAGKSVLKYVTGEGILPTSLQIPESCSLVEIIEIEDRHIILSLTSRGRFFVDGNEIASNITSFFVHSEFLLLTTLQHSLVCVRLDEDGFRRISQDLTIKPWESCWNEKRNNSGLSVRRVERGSNLIVAVSKDPRTILQMPRGNLECIQPRALSLHIIGTQLDNLNYSEAFDIMRKQRINLNLIYDHDPSSFLANAQKFVQDLNNASFLNLFLSELREENVTDTIYKHSYPSPRICSAKSSGEFLREGKVARVCQVLRNVMESREDRGNLVQPILTSLVKNRRIDGLEAALRKIKDIRSRENSTTPTTRGKKSLSEDALRYLLYLVDVNVLFDVAMGMYDFELALFVASKSQKDPKEYIPLLNELKKLEINYMKYRIDKDLKRYESALAHIAKSPGNFQECLEFLRNHDMYGNALKIFPHNSEEYRNIAKVYGDVLMKREKYNEAGIMFSRSGQLESALCAYKAAGSWQDVIVVAVQMDFGPRDMRELYEELVSHLSEEKKYRDAAEILVTYLKQHEDAVSVLCEGKHWREAMRIAHSIKRLDLIETHVKPGVEEHAAYLLFTTSHNRDKFEKHKIRLATVRQENAARDLRMRETLGADFDYPIAGRQVDDLLSETSSVTGSLASQTSRSSRSSGRTYRSSKNRRKQERKLLSIKEGSFFEDLALVRALHQIITMTYADKGQVKLVTQMLLSFERDEAAEKLQKTFGEFINLIERGKSEIWTKSSVDSLDTRDEAIGLKNNQPNNIPQSLLESRFMYPPDAAGSGVWQLDLFNSVFYEKIIF